MRGEPKNKKRRAKLSSNELEIMDALWDLRAAGSRELMERLPRKMAVTTLLTYLSRLEAKGYVRREEADRGYTYRAAVARSSVASGLLNEALGQFGGQISSLVSHFVRTREVSDDERRRLREVVDQLEEQSHENLD